MNLLSGVVVAVVLGALLSLLIYQAKTGVAAVPSTAGEIATVVSLLRSAELPREARIYELGCGWGAMAVGLARAFPEATIIAVELSPLPCLITRIRSARDKNLIVRRADFHREQFRDADGVVTYLGITAVARLATHLDASLRPGTKVVSLCFAFRDRKPTASLSVPSLGGVAELYTWPA